MSICSTLSKSVVSVVRKGLCGGLPPCTRPCILLYFGRVARTCHQISFWNLSCKLLAFRNLIFELRQVLVLDSILRTLGCILSKFVLQIPIKLCSSLFCMYVGIALYVYLSNSFRSSPLLTVKELACQPARVMRWWTGGHVSGLSKLGNLGLQRCFPISAICGAP